MAKKQINDCDLKLLGYGTSSDRKWRDTVLGLCYQEQELQCKKEQIVDILLSVLNKQERKAICYYFGLKDHPKLVQEEIAIKLHLSQSTISNRIISALKKFRKVQEKINLQRVLTKN